jgi:AGZA family xanthine/uracil permease-like MFS transporter
MADDAAPASPRSGLSALRPSFDLAGRGTTPLREIVAGFTTFFVVAGSIVAAANILASVATPTGERLDGVSVLVAGALVAGVASIVLGLVANAPIVIAPNLAIIPVLAFVLGPGLGPEGVMGLVVIEGVAFTVLVALGLRNPLLRAIPPELRSAIVAGIGLLLIFSGLSGAQLLVPTDEGSIVAYPSTPAQALGILAVLGGLLLAVRRVRGAGFIAVVGAVAVGIVLTVTGVVPDLVTMPDPITTQPALEGFLRVNFEIFLEARTAIPTVLMTLFVILVIHASWSLGTAVAVNDAIGATREDGSIPRLGRILAIDGIAGIAAGLVGVGTMSARPESATGVADGARTGVAAVVTGMLLLAMVAVGPLVTLLQPWAIAPALVLGGILLVRRVGEISFAEPEVAIPAIVTIVVTTLDIAAGVGAGFITWVLLHAARGHGRAVHPLTWAIAAVFVLFFLRTALIGFG